MKWTVNRLPTLGPTNTPTVMCFLILPLLIQLVNQSILGVYIIPASAVDETTATSIGCTAVHPVIVTGWSIEAEDVA